MYSMVASKVWQRRTNKIIAAAVVIIGLTMMISTIPQCIYAGVIFIVLALGWLGYIRMKEKKAEDEQSRVATSHSSSPILFIMASQHLPSRPVGPSIPDPNDKPPSYDQVINLDGLPPDYFTVLAAKPPRYEDITAPLCQGEKLKSMSTSSDLNSSNLPGVHTSGSSNITSNGSCTSLPRMMPLTLDVPHLIQDVRLLPSTSWTLNHNDEISPEDIKLEGGGTSCYCGYTDECKSSKEFKKSCSGNLSICSETNSHVPE